MSVIMRRTFAVPTMGQAESLEPIEYVDSIVESSYINALNTALMKRVRELSFEDELFGTSDINPLLIKETYLNTKDEGFWAIDTSVRDPQKKVLTHSLTLYQRIKIPGTIWGSYWSSYETRKICEFYNVKCKRTVPRIITKPTRFQHFQTELATAVKTFKNNAERDGILVSNGINK